jgi:hypothetical protein
MSILKYLTESLEQNTLKLPAHLLNLKGWESNYFDDYQDDELDKWSEKIKKD